MPQAHATWERRVFHAPYGAEWVPGALQKIIGAPGQPALRHLKREDSGEWTIEECRRPDCVPVAEFLTQSGATIWSFVSVVQQSLASLATLHEAGLGHGNVSPSTLLVDRNGNVTLALPAAGHPIIYDESHPADTTPPPLPAGTMTNDLRDLGRTFRAVLCGNPDAKVTTTRTDIAPMVAGWIDWLASPPLGRAARSATEAATVLNDLRTGKPGQKPWEDEEQDATRSYVLPEATKPKKSRKGGGPGLFDGVKPDVNLRSAVISLLVMGGVLGGSIWALNYYFRDKKLDGTAAPLTTGAGVGLSIPGVGSDLSLLMQNDLAFDGIASGYDPSNAAPEQIEGLMAALPEKSLTEGNTGMGTALSDWVKRLEEQRSRERSPEISSTATTAGGPDTDAARAGEKEPEWLYSPEVFPLTGKPSAGRTPGNYYIVWRTHQFILTPEECRATQRAILKTAGFCGVQLLSWTVLPNQAGVVVRVPEPQPLPDDILLRRIALLRGDKVAAGVKTQIEAAEKAGNTAAADKTRLQWNASMGSAAGFLSVVRSVPVVGKEALGNLPLWQQKPLRMHFLQPDTNQILHAASIVDTAAIRAKFVTSAGDWPLCSFAAAMHKYKPALYGVAVLMQNNPHRTLPPTPREDLLNALTKWRRHLGDFPASAVTMPAPAEPTAASVSVQ